MIEIYGKPGCGYCVQARRVCEANDMKYQYIDITDNIQKQHLVERMPAELTTVPQIFVDGAFLEGGYTAFAAYVQNLD